MAVEVRPLGVRCNISCHYCYQDSVRSTSIPGREYDLEAIKAAVLAKGGPFTLFGGEPLLIPKSDLEELLRWGSEQFGHTTIQTNGVLLDEEHIDLFKKHNVTVGLSLDGPGICNDARWAGTAQRTHISTLKVETALELLIEAGLNPSLITTLHRSNATAEMLPRLLDWFRYLDRKGLRFARIHMLEVDSMEVRRSLALSSEENASAMLALAKLEHAELRLLRFDLFREIEALLLAKDQGVSCVWRACDPYTTEAVQGIEGHGESSNCGRTNKAGIDFQKADQQGFERYIALFHTPQAHGGCAGCRFFLVCKGQCPGTSINGDWRNRTEHCESWLRIFQHVEEKLLSDGFTPISADPNRRFLEAAMLAEWTLNRNPSLHRVLSCMRSTADDPGDSRQSA